MAASSRASVGIGVEPPTRTSTFSSSTRSSFAWPPRLRSPISSRKQRAAGGQLELALPRLAGVGERALLVAEQFAFGQRLGNGRAIDRHERPVAAAAEIMDRLGHHLLAGAVFAQDQHGQVGVGHAADDRAQGLDGRAFADQPHLLGRLLGDLAIGRNQLLAVLGVFQRHGGVRGQFAERLFVLLGERPGVLVDQLECAEQLARAAAKRNAQQRAGVIAELGIDVAIDGLGLRRGVDPAGLAACG